MNIFLIGFMGSGKSTIGKLLSTELKMSFLDSDKIIEQKYNASIGQIFLHYGETKFREFEHETLKQFLAQNTNTILAAGGGLPCFFNNMDLMNAEGTTVYLKMSVKAILERLQELPPSAKAVRPLLANKSEKELLSYINETLAAREEFYNRAKLIISNEGRDAHIAIDRLKTALKYMTL